MLRLANDDKILIESSYKTFLDNVKILFEKSNIKTGLDCYSILCDMLINGQFSMEGKFEFNENFSYLTLSNMDSRSIHVMYGVCCCRHVSEFVNDIMSLLGFDTKLYYVHIDDQGNWHPCAPVCADHVAVLLTDNTDEYILDPMNNFILRKEEDKSLTLFDKNMLLLDRQRFVNFTDDNVQNIGKVLKKYYHLQSLGINHI